MNNDYDYVSDKFFNLICTLARLNLGQAPSYIGEKMPLLNDKSIYVWHSLSYDNQMKVREYYHEWMMPFPEELVEWKEDT